MSNDTAIHRGNKILITRSVNMIYEQLAYDLFKGDFSTASIIDNQLQVTKAGKGFTGVPMTEEVNVDLNALTSLLRTFGGERLLVCSKPSKLTVTTESGLTIFRVYKGALFFHGVTYLSSKGNLTERTDIIIDALGYKYYKQTGKFNLTADDVKPAITSELNKLTGHDLTGIASTIQLHMNLLTDDNEVVKVMVHICEFLNSRLPQFPSYSEIIERPRFGGHNLYNFALTGKVDGEELMQVLNFFLEKGKVTDLTIKALIHIHGTIKVEGRRHMITRGKIISTYCGLVMSKHMTLTDLDIIESVTNANEARAFLRMILLNISAIKPRYVVPAIKSQLSGMPFAGECLKVYQEPYTEVDAVHIDVSSIEKFRKVMDEFMLFNQLVLIPLNDSATA